jgi:hypothetical protein
LLAVVSAEAFINELPYIAEPWAAHEGDQKAAPGWIGALNSILLDAERSHSSIQTKFMFAKFIMTGTGFDRGGSVFQQFETLIDVRNFVVHAKPREAKLTREEKTDEYSWEQPGFIARLRDSKVLSDAQERETIRRLRAGSLETNVTSFIFRREIATWACETVSNVVIELLDAIPTPYKSVTDLLYRKDFLLPQDFACQKPFVT